MNSNIFREKADALKRELKHTRVVPECYVDFCEDEHSFQNLRVEKTGNVSFPIELQPGKSVILDFGRHCVGYLHYALSACTPILDSPLGLEFAFGEFPLEIVKTPDEYKGTLGNGWIQREVKKEVFLPGEGKLDRRYSFRYVKITRVENQLSKVFLTDIFADCVSAVDIQEAKKFEIPDPVLKKIYDVSLTTLKECEQDVFEDGPKRDRRLWIGDLRLQAMSDYVSFGNLELIKRCIYLFAAHRIEDKLVAPCLYADCPPHIDGWCFHDYSLYFVSCLFDYVKNTGDLSLANELYGVAKEQIEFVKTANGKERNIGSMCFVDWCPNLEKYVAGIGIYMYVIGQFKELSCMLGKNSAEYDREYEYAKALLMEHYSEKLCLFVSKDGQVSWHSQVWAVLSGALSTDMSCCILDRIKEYDTEYTMRTPYMIHYYIEALYKAGKQEYAMECIKDFWMQMIECGYDCCPEVFNPENQMESPYNAPEINSACHAWSCTPIYWIHKYYNRNK